MFVIAKKQLTQRTHAASSAERITMPQTESEKGKEVHGHKMSATDNFFMLLMPVAASVHIWFAYSVHIGALELIPGIGKLAIFFALWALRNYYLQGSKKERGQFTMGLVALGSLVAQLFSPYIGHVMASVGALSVFLSYLFVFFLLARSPLAKLAKMAQKSTTWALVFKVYLGVQGLTWLVTLVQLVQDTTAMH